MTTEERLALLARIGPGLAEEMRRLDDTEILQRDHVTRAIGRLAGAITLLAQIVHDDIAADIPAGHG